MTTPTFTNYAEAQEWIADGQARIGNKAFTATPEYHAVHSQIAALYAAEHPNGRKRRTRIERPLFGSSLILHGNR